MTDELGPVAEPTAIRDALLVDLLLGLGEGPDEIMAMTIDRRVAVVTAAVEAGRLPLDRRYVVLRDLLDLGVGKETES